jgi:hypothetical protein
VETQDLLELLQNIILLTSKMKNIPNLEVSIEQKYFLNNYFQL